MLKKKAFSLIEVIVSVAIILVLAVAFTPGLTKHQQQVEVDGALTQIQNAFYKTRSLAISSNNISDAGGQMRQYILILNITNSDQKYVRYFDKSLTGTNYGSPPDAELCRAKPANTTVNGLPAFNDKTNGCEWQQVPKKTYTIYSAETMSLSSERLFIQNVKYPDYISLYYDYPCHIANSPGSCLANTEPYFLKPHFRNYDAMIGFNGRYFDYPAQISNGDQPTYWYNGLWSPPSASGGQGDYYTGDTTNWPRKVRIVFVWGKDAIPNPVSTWDARKCDTTTHLYQEDSTKPTYPCKILEIDNVTAVSNVL